MRLQGAIVREQGVTFAVVVVKSQVLNNSTEADHVADAFRPVFPGLPVVLMAQDHRGRPTYYGRSDIAKFLSRVPFQAIPWCEYTCN